MCGGDFGISLPAVPALMAPCCSTWPAWKDPSSSRLPLAHGCARRTMSAMYWNRPRTSPHPQDIPRAMRMLSPPPILPSYLYGFVRGLPFVGAGPPARSLDRHHGLVVHLGRLGFPTYRRASPCLNRHTSSAPVPLESSFIYKISNVEIVEIVY